jgi:AbiU2
MNTDQQATVKAFCEECVWARCARTHFADLYESGGKRIELLSEVAHTFFGDLTIILQEYILLQQSKLTDPASSGAGKNNLTTNYLLTLDWEDKTRKELVVANETLMQFRDKIIHARRKLIAHTDVESRLISNVLGSFDQSEEREFWSALQHFASTAHDAACGGPFEIVAAMP